MRNRIWVKSEVIPARFLQDRSGHGIRFPEVRERRFSKMKKAPDIIIISICFFEQFMGHVKIATYPTDQLQVYREFLPYGKNLRYREHKLGLGGIREQNGVSFGGKSMGSATHTYGQCNIERRE